MARIIPPVLGLGWMGAQVAITALAGGRRRFPGQPVLAGALGLGALALGGTAVGLFRRAGTTPMPHRPSEASALVTDGVYRYTRNPMYVSILIGLLAVSVGTGRLRTLLALPGMFWSLQPQIDAEESALAELFGAQYATYRARVPRWL